MHVALVGRGAVQGQRAQEAVAGLLEDDALLEHAEPEAAELLRDLRGEQTRVSGLLLQTAAQLLRRVIQPQLRFCGDHDLAHEGAHALAQLGERGG